MSNAKKDLTKDTQENLFVKQQKIQRRICDMPDFVSKQKMIQASNFKDMVNTCF